MSRSRRVSATTSEPKPGALVPAGFGRSIAAISGWALRDAAASGLDFAMGGLLAAGLLWLGRIGARSNRIAGRDATLTVGGARVRRDVDIIRFSRFVLSGEGRPEGADGTPAAPQRIALVAVEAGDARSVLRASSGSASSAATSSAMSGRLAVRMRRRSIMA